MHEFQDYHLRCTLAIKEIRDDFTRVGMMGDPELVVALATLEDALHRNWRAFQTAAMISLFDRIPAPSCPPWDQPLYDALSGRTADCPCDACTAARGRPAGNDV